MFRFAVLGSLFFVPLANAAGDLVVFVGSGATRRPIARFDGERWSATCTAPPGATEVTPQSVRRVAPGSSEWNAVEPVARDIFSRREREQRLAVQRLAAATMTLDAVHAAGSAASATYYFEASKRVEDTSANADPDTDPAGVLTLRVTGWLQARSGRSIPIASKADVEWQQLDRAPAAAPADLTPVGTLRQGEALLWVMQRDEGGAPSFILYEPRGSAVRMVLRTRC